jgi:hypothetical protein
MGWFFSLLDISLDTANKFYTFGWASSLSGAAITFIGVVFLMWGTRERDRDFEDSIGHLHKSAATSEERSRELEKGNLTLQRDLEHERVERIKMEQRFGARHFTPEQRDAIILAFKGKPMLVQVRCIAEGEAMLAANNFAVVLREAGLTVPPVLDVGLTIPPSLGVEVYDPAGQGGLFAKTMMANIPEARFRNVPFSIGGENSAPAIPAMVVRYRTAQ